jgi:hypothetical protein
MPYGEYTVNITANDELGKSRAGDLEEATHQHFPGISVSISQSQSDTDCIASVSGGSRDTREKIETWLARRREELM